ncbi:HDOD domain-containing protein [Desulfurivibrio alkaliphilus]|uniref:Metal dependent phosphohydrolase n=1 Tax=Desulfurivibrio alkaliphilus (strain DSM 19089 / UNIQEM U267 / AHT2) TaxID=589865 RepID=D6Z6X2_DESAT|nr:HDOD domain-containing protein [Desulfurivibrio alkaliphilus]ADH86959.1 metal dependent phosphohydrolase [Desulfurivibrio alkaliphilus AHT 2]
MSNAEQEKKIRRFIERMPSLSTTVTKVMEICNQPETSANDLNRVISLDPVLTGQVLKLINSAYYSLPNQIGSLTRAIILLGVNTIKNLALSTAVLGGIGREDSFQALNMDKFWTHSLGVGVTARMLAGRRGAVRQQQEEYFVAGLLHDLGKIPLNVCFPQEYRKIQQLAAYRRLPLDRAEAAVLGLDHGRVGRMIGEKWQLNADLVELLAGHHRASAEIREDLRSMAALVAVADAFMNLQGPGAAGNSYPDKANLKALLQQEKINWRALAGLLPEVEAEIEKAQIFLTVARQ